MTNEELDIYSEEILDTVSAHVKMYRESKGYSQMQLALEIGMSSGAYLGRAELRKDKKENYKKCFLYENKNDINVKEDKLKSHLVECGSLLK